jgi:hypothetical protein
VYRFGNQKDTLKITIIHSLTVSENLIHIKMAGDGQALQNTPSPGMLPLI